MATATRYRPAYFEGFPHEEAEYANADDLMALPWIRSWSEEPAFARFEVAPYHAESPKHAFILSAMMEGGDGHVAAFLSAFPFPGSDGFCRRRGGGG